MPLPRSAQVSLDATPIYHVVSRRVRRQLLCGKDFVTGKDFSHRRDWIRQRIFELAEIFAIDVAGYALMSSHFRLVVCIQKDQALAWSDREAVERWCRLFGGDWRALLGVQALAVQAPLRRHASLAKWSVDTLFG